MRNNAFFTFDIFREMTGLGILVAFVVFPSCVSPFMTVVNHCTSHHMGSCHQHVTNGNFNAHCNGNSPNCFQQCTSAGCSMICSSPNTCSQNCISSGCQSLVCNSNRCTQTCFQSRCNMKCNNTCSNCNQICQGGSCNMTCPSAAKRCIQNCNSKMCHMTCPRGVQYCEQTCVGGTCNMICAGHFCRRNCQAGSHCRILSNNHHLKSLTLQASSCNHNCTSPGCNLIGNTCNQKCYSNKCKLAFKAKTHRRVSRQLCLGGNCILKCMNRNGRCQQDCKGGKCTTVNCNSKFCFQRCLGGACNMRCNALECKQICIGGGCNMRCDSKAKKCSQTCQGGGCRVMMCNSKHCIQSCLGGGCAAKCSGIRCNQKCLGGGCRLICTRKAKTCSRYCLGGGCLRLNHKT